MKVWVSLTANSVGNFAISQLPHVEINEKSRTYDYDADFLYTDDVFVVVNDKLLSFSDSMGLFTVYSVFIFVLRFYC